MASAPNASVSRAVMQFIVAGVVALALVAVGTTLLSRRAARAEALRDAQTLTGVLAIKVIGPNLSDGVLSGDLTAMARLDAVVPARVLLEPVVRSGTGSAPRRGYDASGQPVARSRKSRTAVM